MRIFIVKCWSCGGVMDWANPRYFDRRYVEQFADGAYGGCANVIRVDESKLPESRGHKPGCRFRGDSHEHDGE